MNNRLVSFYILFSLGITWGSGYAIARFATTHGVAPLGYTFWQSLGPAIILSVCCFISRQRLSFKPRYLAFYCICGLLGIAIPNTNMYFAAAHLPASLLALIVNTVPIMIYPMALLAKQERFQLLRFTGVVMAIIGVLCLVLPNANFAQPQQARWVLLALITPFCFALFTTHINPRRPRESTPLSLAAGMMIISTLLLLPLVITTHSFYPLHWPFSLPSWLILFEMVLSSLGYVLFFWLLKISGPVYYSLVDGVVAVTGLIWGVIIFDENFNLWQGIAVILILAAIAVMTWLRNEQNTVT